MGGSTPALPSSTLLTWHEARYQPVDRAWVAADGQEWQVHTRFMGEIHAEGQRRIDQRLARQRKAALAARTADGSSLAASIGSLQRTCSGVSAHAMRAQHRTPPQLSGHRPAPAFSTGRPTPAASSRDDNFAARHGLLAHSRSAPVLPGTGSALPPQGSEALVAPTVRQLLIEHA